MYHPVYADFTVAGKKAIIHADGHDIPTDDPNLMEKLHEVFDAAAKKGTYEGKSLEYGSGGRSRLFADLLKAKNPEMTHQEIDQVVRMNAITKARAAVGGSS